MLSNCLCNRVCRSLCCLYAHACLPVREDSCSGYSHAALGTARMRMHLRPCIRAARGVDALPWARRRALWRGFMQACNDTEQVASMNGMDAAGAQLDWFGVAVKAAEIPVWTARMKMLARKVAPPHPLARHPAFCRP